MDSIPHLKRCTKCGADKPLGEFNKDKHCKDGLQRWCRECSKAQWDRYVSDPDNRARVLAQQRKHWENTPERRERKRDQIRERYHTNPEHKRKQFEYSNAAVHRRRARAQSNGGSHTAKEWRALCAQYNHRCLCCGEAKQLTKDHIVPLEKGGTDDISNLQPLCLDCNLRKHTRIIDYRPIR
jgi:5-methylcytosine-specific restriction endonuclease McrA